MDFKRYLPIPQKFEVGHILLESRNDIELLWEVVSVVDGVAEDLRQVYNNSHRAGSFRNSYEVGAIFKLNKDSSILNTSKIWTLVSLPRNEVKLDQLWYNRETRGALTITAENRRDMVACLQHGNHNWHLIKRNCGIEFSDTSRLAEVGDIYEWIETSQLFEDVVTGTLVRVHELIGDHSCTLKTLDGKKLDGAFGRALDAQPSTWKLFTKALAPVEKITAAVGKTKMDFKNHIPPGPSKFEVGHVLLESRETERLWEVLHVEPDGTASKLKLIHENVGGNYYKVGYTYSWGGSVADLTTAEAWVVVSLPCNEVKAGQVWYDRHAKRLLEIKGVSFNGVYCCAKNSTKAEFVHQNWFTTPGMSLIQDAPQGQNIFPSPDELIVGHVYTFQAGKQFPYSGIYKYNKPKENSMFTQTHKVSEVKLKPIDQETISATAHELAKMYGYRAHDKKDRTVVFRKHGKLVDAIVATPETVEKLFRDSIVGNLDLTVLGAASAYGIVDKIVFTEI